MSITRKQLDAAMAADSRLVSMGTLCPQKVSSQDAAWLAEATRVCQESIRTGLPVTWALPSEVFHKTHSERM